MLKLDSPLGTPGLGLSVDLVSTAIEIILSGVKRALPMLSPDMLEVPISKQVAQSMRLEKRRRGLDNLEIYPEHEVYDDESEESILLGRIDICLRFLQQFGDEGAYFAVECKRVSGADKSLNRKYVNEGVHRFVTGQYSRDHEWGCMLGFLVAPTMADCVAHIDEYMQGKLGRDAKLARAVDITAKPDVYKNSISRNYTTNRMFLIHAFVEI